MFSQEWSQRGGEEDAYFLFDGHSTSTDVTGAATRVTGFLFAALHSVATNG